MNIDQLLGEILRKCRLKKKRLSQEKVAVFAGIDRSYYSRIERGESRPTLVILFKISQIIEVPVSQIIAEMEEKMKKN